MLVSTAQIWLDLFYFQAVDSTTLAEIWEFKELSKFLWCRACQLLGVAPQLEVDCHKHRNPRSTGLGYIGTGVLTKAPDIDTCRCLCSSQVHSSSALLHVQPKMNKPGVYEWGGSNSIQTYRYQSGVGTKKPHLPPGVCKTHSCQTHLERKMLFVGHSPGLWDAWATAS